ncbi:electron transport complex subunit RsxG [Candidatus Ferrigenium straubiae]|jgi:electron transport complex protein RnfG|uniref:electron transport complex subunit RsxG n=1 Tax=Candidatus Ferrigenium straubiae TaxID=2919506 RepID=UPI003F4AE6DE
MITGARATLRTALNLLFFTLIGTAMLAWTFELTHEAIARSVEKEKLKLIAQIAPPAAYDNDIMKDTLQLAEDKLLGGTSIVYRGRLNGQPSIAVLQAVAPDGYSGRINLIIAIRSDGRISGVRVVSHRETPGLGDYIEIGRSNWITGFNDASLENRKDGEWKVRKDGGSFDYRAGATITPRAIVKAVHKALQYYAQHRDELFAEPPPGPGKENKK